MLMGALWLVACPGWYAPQTSGGEGEGDGPPGFDRCEADINTGYPEPQNDVLDAVGSASSLDVATWNIKFFPATSQTPEDVADIITSLDLDLIAVQEVADVAAWEQLLRRLPEHNGVLSTQRYGGGGSEQIIGVIYRCTELVVKSSTLRFTGDGYNFPRSPLFVEFHYGSDQDGFDFTTVVLHLKAEEPNTPNDDSSERRGRSLANLENFIRDEVDDAGDTDAANFLILGDFNQTLDQADADNMAPFQDDSRYTIHTEPLTGQRPGSYITNFVAVIDHIVTTRRLSERVGDGVAVVTEPDDVYDDYRNDISDHRPVVLPFLEP
jgi:endonuclease/exonuclease/phosphatase family metal-dependent hydrolase